MRRQPSPAEWLVYVVPLIVLGFVVTHVLAVTVTHALHEQATCIEQTTTRRHHLSDVRGALHRLAMTVALAEGGAPFDRKSFDEARAALDKHLEHLHASPPAPEEGTELEEELRAAIHHAEEALDRSLRETGHPDGPHDDREAPALLLIRRAEAAVERLSDRQLDVTETESRAIAATDRRLRVLSPTFDGVAIAFALVLFLLARKAARQYARLVEERSRSTEERAAELDAFAGRVAHDLRNPLGSIALRLQSNEKKFADDPRVLHEVSKTRAAVTRMNGLIDGLLAFARAGGHAEPGATSDVREVLDGVLGDFATEAETKNVELVAAPAPPMTVACPAGALTSILGNLVRNALKFVGDGPEPVCRVVVRTERTDGCVRIHVEDTGPGIPAGMERAIFEPFFRAKASAGRPGLGLGLATVKRLVEAHRGRVTVQPRNGGSGSCFIVELPVAQPA